MNKGTFLAEPQTRSYSQTLENISSVIRCRMESTYQTDRLGHQGPDAHKSTNDEASKDSLDLGYTTLLGICRESGDKVCSDRCEQDLRLSAPDSPQLASCTHRVGKVQDKIDDPATSTGRHTHSMAP